MNDFRNKLNYIFDDLQEIIEKSWVFTTTDFALRPLARDKIWRAITMHGHIKAGLIEKFGEKVISEKNTYYLQLGKYRLYFKKLNNNLCPSRPLTNRARTLQGYCQLQIDFGEQFEVSYIPVFIGYHLNYTEDLISGVYAVKMTEGKPEWIYPICTDLESTNIKTQTSTTERLVKPKRTLLGIRKTS